MARIEAILGAHVPPVGPNDLSRLWNFMRETRAAWETIHSGDAPSYAPAFDPSVIADASRSSTSPVALWLRTCVIEIMYRRDLLHPWLQADQLSESVFRLAATWPLISVEQFNPREFVDSLRAWRNV
jgi:hypothetical protein